MQNHKWQPVPGMPGAFVYPYLRSPDVLSSNSYLIEFPDGSILIDPGALPQQTADLLAVLAGRESNRTQPLTVFLTHCHLDHSREVAAFVNHPSRPVWLAVQEEGAKALAAADVRQTAADLYGAEIFPVHTHIPLLTAEDVRTLKARGVRLAQGIEAQIRSETRPGNPPSVRQFIDLGGNTGLEILPCPGHTPDSVCYRIGDLLFIGDLLSASRPLVAGSQGWNQQHLKHSMDVIIGLLEEGSILWCCPGHGNLLPADKTLDLLRRQRDKAAHADDIEKMDPQRLFRTVDVALEVIDEAEEVFTAIAGRLLYVSDRLEMLDEAEAARRCREAMDMDTVDALLQKYRDLSRSLAAGNIPRVMFANEALMVVEKLRKSFSPEPLGAILPAALVNRGQRLLLDFIGIAQGLRNLEEFVPVEIGALLDGVDKAWHASPHLEESVAACVDDRALFAAELARRIGHPPPARRIPVVFRRGANAPLAHVAAARFCDTLIQFLEQLALVGAASAAVQAGTEGDQLVVEIRTAGRIPDESPRVRGKLRSFSRRFALAGFELTTEPDVFKLSHPAGRGMRV